MRIIYLHKRLDKNVSSASQQTLELKNQRASITYGGVSTRAVEENFPFLSLTESEVRRHLVP